MNNPTMQTSRFATGSRVLALTALLMLCLGLTAMPLVAQDEEPMDSTAPPPLPFMEVEPDQPLHHAVFDLRGLVQPTLRIVNPDAAQPLDLQVLTVGAAHDADALRRSLVMQLEPGATQSLDLVAAAGFDEVTVVAKGAFEGEIVDHTARGAVTVALDVVPPVSQSLPLKSYGIRCSGQWTLTCDSPNCVGQTRGPSPGYVYAYENQFNPHDVYWEDHVSTGNWATSDLGGCWGVWSPSVFKPDCPKRMRDCIARYYKVTGTIQQP